MAGDEEPFVGIRKDKKRCTDCLCCVLFAVAIAGLAVLGYIGATEGNPEALQQFVSGRDYNGLVCGVDEAVKDFPYTYFALPGSQVVTHWDNDARSLLSAVCTTRCPEGNETLGMRGPNLCPANAYDLTDLRCTWYGGNTTRIANYCIDTSAFDIGANAGAWLEDLRRSGTVLAFVPLISIMLGFLFFWIIYQCGTFLIWVALLAVAALPAVTGAILYVHATSQEGGDDPFQWVDTVTRDSLTPKEQQTTAYVLWAISGVVLLLLLCSCHTVNSVGKVISFASDFIKDTPSQILQPLFFGVFQIAAFAICIAVFAVVATVNSEEGNEHECITAGDFYCVKWNSDLQFYGLAYIFAMCIWIISFLVALSHYGTAFAVGEWYFAASQDGDRQILGCCDFRHTLQGIGSGLLNHSGSLAFGSLIVTICKLIRLALAWAKAKEDVAGNPVVRLFYTISACIVNCITRFIEFVSTHAYVEIALTGQGFCSSAKEALKFTIQHPMLFALVGRAAFGVRVLGMGFVSAGTTFIVSVVLYAIPPEGLSSPMVPMVATALIGAAFGEVMLHPLSSSARACLHCFIMDEDHSKSVGSHTAQRAPRKMAAFVDEHAPRESPTSA